mmetsp:Transcript_32249/g.63985  ORF Transcript_32249/g.63985 Transcript_32249/m.63985 type:complete len:206 (+) Transcript_32249:26-643(+)
MDRRSLMISTRRCNRRHLIRTRNLARRRPWGLSEPLMAPPRRRLWKPPRAPSIHRGPPTRRKLSPSRQLRELSPRRSRDSLAQVRMMTLPKNANSKVLALSRPTAALRLLIRVRDAMMHGLHPWEHPPVLLRRLHPPLVALAKRPPALLRRFHMAAQLRASSHHHLRRRQLPPPSFRRCHPWRPHRLYRLCPPLRRKLRRPTPSH